MTAYSTGTYDCFSDVGVCCCVYFCFPCAVCELAKQIEAEDTHGCPQVCKAICALEFFVCALCCCPENIWFCFLSSLYKKSMKKHGITEPLTPCGNAEFCGMHCQMCWCASCTMCVMMREAKKLPK